MCWASHIFPHLIIHFLFLFRPSEKDRPRVERKEGREDASPDFCEPRMDNIVYVWEKWTSKKAKKVLLYRLSKIKVWKEFISWYWWLCRESAAGGLGGLTPPNK